MPLDIREVLINCAAAFGTGILWYELTKKLFNLDPEDEEKKEDVSSGDSSFYIFAVDAEEAKEREGFSDDKPIYVIRKLKVQKTRN